MKKIIYQYLLPTLFSAFVLISCNKYLDVQPKGVQLLETITDYDQWLNSTDNEKFLLSEINMLADNVDNPVIPSPPSSTKDRVYTWQPQFIENVTASPIIWSYSYKGIYYFNAVINGIDEATGGTEGQKKSLKAEALLGRAFQYFYLVNLYGEPYNPNAAEDNLAVPFVTSNDINDPVPLRSTVQEIYDHIITDITTAIPDLPQDNSQNRFRGSIAAAYSVLARTYFYMHNYSEAARNAQLALDNGPDVVLNYSSMSNAGAIPAIIKSPDAIYARLGPLSIFDPPIPKIEFLQSFDTKDLRLQLFYTSLGDYSFITRGKTKYNQWNGKAYPNWGTSVAEMRLIIAEAAARANDLTTAIQQLDQVRKYRFKTADYVKYDPANPIQEEVLQKVLSERAFEFPYCGIRWFDMRRLDSEGRMPEVNRYDGSGNIIATLSPGSPKYTLQIPVQVLYFNPDWPQNPWDEE